MEIIYKMLEPIDGAVIALSLFVGVMLVAMNAAIFLGTYAAGKPFEFTYIFNVVSPLICAVFSWQIAEVNTK